MGGMGGMGGMGDMASMMGGMDACTPRTHTRKCKSALNHARTTGGWFLVYVLMR